MTEIRKSTDPCRCCWHCRYFIRPLPIAGMLDGPVTDVVSGSAKLTHLCN